MGNGSSNKEWMNELGFSNWIFQIITCSKVIYLCDHIMQRISLNVWSKKLLIGWIDKKEIKRINISQHNLKSYCETFTVHSINTNSRPADGKVASTHQGVGSCRRRSWACRSGARGPAAATWSVRGLAAPTPLRDDERDPGCCLPRSWNRSKVVLRAGFRNK